MSIDLPKKPSIETLRMLIRANHFLEHAKMHANMDNEFDTMISIHNLDNSIEYMLRIIIRHLDIENLTGRTINTCELAQLVGEVEKFLRENTTQHLSYIQEIKFIREMRNMVQHAMTMPVSEVKQYLMYGEKFIEKCLQKFFGLRINDIAYSTLVKSPEIKEHLLSAETKLKEGKYLESIVMSRNAFEYACFIYRNDTGQRYSKVMAMLELKKKFTYVGYYINALDDRVNLDLRGIDVQKYAHYLEYIRCIPSEYCAEWHGNTVLQRAWEKADAEFCYSFVANSILQLENSEFAPIQDVTSQLEDIFEFQETFGNIRIGEIFSNYGCLYLDDKHNSAKLFYCNSDTVNLLRSELNKNIISYSLKRYKNNELDCYHNRLILVEDYQINILLNNPATWEIIVSYKDIPFTLIDECRSINIDDLDFEQLKAIDIDEKTAKIICEYTNSHTLDSVSAAFELEDIIEKAEGSGIYNLYSKHLIKKLLENQ